MFCTKCGSKLNEDSKFCTKCGKSVGKSIKTNTDNEDPIKFNKPYAQKKKKRSILAIWTKMPGILKLVLIYLLLNAGLYLGQEAYYYQDTQKMNKLESEMNAIESDSKSLEDYATGNELPEPYYTQYQNDVEQYNQKANEYNELAKKSGNRWWLIPIPIGHGSVHTK